MNVIFDTNILIDYVRGIPEAIREVRQHLEATISIVTWIEVMTGARSEQEADRLRAFLSRFECLDLNAAVAEEAMAVRNRYALKLADAVVVATARVQCAALVTRDVGLMHLKRTDVVIPYRL